VIEEREDGVAIHNQPLPLQHGVEVVGLVGEHRRVAKSRLDDVSEDLLEWHAVSFVHRKEEKRHDDFRFDFCQVFGDRDVGQWDTSLL